MKHNLKELLLHYSLQDYEILYYYSHFISGETAQADEIIKKLQSRGTSIGTRQFQNCFLTHQLYNFPGKR